MERWRTGRKVGRTIYRQVGDGPSEDDPLIGVMDTPDLAAGAVSSFNHQNHGLSDEGGSRSVRPYVQADPMVNFGRPCMGGTGTSVEAVVELIWAGDGVEDVAEEFGVDRPTVLVACWFVAAYGLADMAAQRDGRFKRWGRAQAKRWEQWASDSDRALWQGRYGEVEDPPSTADR